MRVAKTVKMASVSRVPDDSIILKESVDRGHHVIKNIWTPRSGEILLVRQEAGNTHDRRAIALLKADRTVVGYVPRKFSRVFWHFPNHGGKMSCEVTGRRSTVKVLRYLVCTSSKRSL